jgi:hypothetical protein
MLCPVVNRAIRFGDCVHAFETTTAKNKAKRRFQLLFEDTLNRCGVDSEARQILEWQCRATPFTVSHRSSSRGMSLDDVLAGRGQFGRERRSAAAPYPPGRIIDVEMAQHPIEYAETGQLAVLDDVTKRRSWKINCGRHRKWKPWGCWPGVAHDFNNLLTIISGTAS